MILCAVCLCILFVVLTQLLRLAVSDCDLTLQWEVWFGKRIDSLKAQVVWVTGASSGIGESLAYQLAAAGCKLVLSARRESELQRVKKQCLLSGPLKDEDVLVLALDSVKFDTHASAVQLVMQHFGQIDILVNNAGRTQRAAWVSTSIEVDREMLELNVLGVVSLTRCVLPHMIKSKKGQIVVMSSVAGKMGVPFSCSYTGSKHALHGWFESLRVEASEHNIDVTMLCPGPVISNMLESAFTDTPGQVYGGSMKAGEKRMPTSRCAYLSVVAIANRCDEVWIAHHPVLAFMYVAQYCPSIARSLWKKKGVKEINKIREGRQ